MVAAYCPMKLPIAKVICDNTANMIALRRWPAVSLPSVPVFATATTPPMTNAANAICHRLGGLPASVPKMRDVAGYDMTIGRVSDTDPAAIAAKRQMVAIARNTPEAAGSHIRLNWAVGNSPVPATQNV